jgi:hypothetical protein
MAAFVRMLVFCVVNVLMDVLLTFMLMRMFMSIRCMATHKITTSVYLCRQRNEFSVI